MSSIPHAELLEQTARTIREVFVLEWRRQHEATTGRESTYKPSPKYDGGMDRGGKTHSPVWPQIAARVLEQNLDPVAFVSCQFVPLEVPPLPPELLGAKAMSRYQEYTKTIVPSLREAFVAQKESAGTEVAALAEVTGDSEIECWLAVLSNAEQSLTALYRYCAVVALQREFNDPRLKKLGLIFQQPAMLEYGRHRDAYDEVWGDMIPVAFRERSRHVSFAAADWTEN